MILFIASEVLFFAAFFWAFFDSALYPNSPEMPVRTEADGGIWPPKGIHGFGRGNGHFRNFSNINLRCGSYHGDSAEPAGLTP